MRLIAMLCSLAKAGVEHLVAVDGAYELYPDCSARRYLNER